jgi:hypothetical protein
MENSTNLVRYFVGLDALDTIYAGTNWDTIKTVVQHIEELTGCKLYNKNELLEEIKNKTEQDQTKLIDNTYSSINKNLIPEINFSKLFNANSLFGFNLAFTDDKILIIHESKTISSLDELHGIKEFILTEKKMYLPTIKELYVNNIITVLEKLINRDPTVKYNLVNIPKPYWCLFELRCNQVNKFSEGCYLDDVISGRIYQTTKLHAQLIDPVVDTPVNAPVDAEMQTILMQIQELENSQNLATNMNVSTKTPSEKEKKDLDEQHRMEIMSYLNDEEMCFFLDKISQYGEVVVFAEHDAAFCTNVTAQMKNYIEIMSTKTNKMIKFYFVNKLFECILLNSSILSIKDNLKKIFTDKINELTMDIVIVQTAGLSFSTEITNTFAKARELIDKMEKQANPNYVSQWINSPINAIAQQEILNQIITQANPPQSHHQGYSNQAVSANYPNQAVSANYPNQAGSESSESSEYALEENDPYYDSDSNEDDD